MTAVAAEAHPADLGSASPALSDLRWIAGGAPPAAALTVLAFWSAEGGDAQAVVAEASELAEDGSEGFTVALVCDAAGEAASHVAERLAGLHHAVAEADATTAWLGSPDAARPAGVLVGADGILLWRGHWSGLRAALARERAGGFDRQRLAETARLRGQLREALAAEAKDESLAQALELTGRILAIEPVDEEAIRLRLDLCRHLGRKDLHRQTLDRLPLASLPADLASALAWERATDEDLGWRHPDLALRLAEHAHRLNPADASIEDTYARVLHLIGRHDDAIAAQLRAVSLAPEDTALSDALDYYREVQALYAEHARAP